ncbi:hypothetical protein BXZ70DRAFT_1008559 [Cristinia sonorae]|uniref:Uncharacterized protein n=1 Tax=Cristinia sonorae TaxID=1940300 RepID=A0A8K0UNK9_9AGAR|nr:hypothetical protein BXZ70DRAFT_1008559 [Cristinia sonorae]
MATFAAQTLSAYHVSSGIHLEGILGRALKENCVVVGIHKSFMEFPTLPLFALLPLEGDSRRNASFSPLSFRKAEEGLVPTCEVSVGRQPVCDTYGQVVSPHFVPQSIIVDPLEGTHHTELKVTSINPYDIAGAMKSPVAVVKMGPTMRKSLPLLLCNSGVQIDRAEPPQSIDYHPEMRPGQSPVVRMPASAYTLLCERRNDLRIERTDWTGPPYFESCPSPEQDRSPSSGYPSTSTLSSVPLSPFLPAFSANSLDSGLDISGESLKDGLRNFSSDSEDSPQTAARSPYMVQLSKVHRIIQKNKVSRGITESSEDQDAAELLGAKTGALSLDGDHYQELAPRFGTSIPGHWIPTDMPRNLWVHAHKQVCLGIRASAAPPMFSIFGSFPILSRWPHSPSEAPSEP